MTPKHIKTILYNLLCALFYIHSAQVLHRDLKPANVLVDDWWAVKLCDFGLARSIAPKKIKEEFKEEISPEIIEASLQKQSEETTTVTPNTVESTMEVARDDSIESRFNLF